MDDFQNALDGKTSTEGWTAEKLVDYHKFLKGAVKTEESVVGGLREAKRAEADRVEALKAEEIRIRGLVEAAQAQIPKPPEVSQFRTEQIEKAKRKLMEKVKLSPEQLAVVEEKFKRLDTGKADADFIYEDLLSALAAANPSKFLELSQEREAAERRAAEELESQAAGAGGSGGGGGEPKKFSDAVMDLAKKAGITPEAAKRQLDGGMSRTYE